jgi:hydrogenase-4 component F
VTNLTSLATAVLTTPVLTALVLGVLSRRWLTALAVSSSLLTAALALVLAFLSGRREVSTLYVIDPGGGLLVAVVAVVGVASVLVSPAYLKTAHSTLVRPERRTRAYFVALFAFWAVLLAVPIAGNLGAAWLLVEATTAASALLVGFSGKPRALEAGWKYLILTSLGLGVALFGMVLLAEGIPLGGLGVLSWQRLTTFSAGPHTALVAYLLLLAGLAAKIGWAPVHNWLPDAHSEAPPPVSALLSAALLPAVMLIAWRSERALAPVLGARTVQGVVIAFGLVSLAVAVPFLWRSMAWKRLLAYSSLEHMGVIALGIGFGSPLALAGVAVHVVGHALAKALGFYAATPLLAVEPRAAGHQVTGITRSHPGLGAAMGLSLGTLAGIPPSPLFISEVLIIAGGFQSGRPWVAVLATLLLALGFLGLAHALVEVLAGKTHRTGRAPVAGMRGVVALTAVAAVLLLALSAAAVWLPGSGLLRGLEQLIT